VFSSKSLSFSPDGRILASGTHSGNINLWNVETGQLDHVYETKGRFAMSCAFVFV
jgi:WD repeat-containing protein 61